jgi:Asp-tRNA(Asn)/Glu-tRNA(Gln) amidotransferase A subunit family amidase
VIKLVKHNKEDICFMSAYELAEKIKTQELTSIEITETIIERIEKINPIINAYCTPTFDLARDMAKKADAAVKKGEKIGLLHGIPISIKDETDTKGIKTTYGCVAYENYVPEEDDITVRRVKDAGAVILGKTNTPAFGYKGVTDNLLFGPTKNPWNLEKTSGGSSGGAAAAVAAGISPLAIGSDGGGSIRIPSCFCGVFGLKPHFGRIPQAEMILAGYLGTFVHRGPIVRYVKDAALMLDVLAGPDDIDRYSLPKPNFSYSERIEEQPKKLKIGFSFDLGFIRIIDEEVKNSVLNSVQKFEKFDWIVEKSDRINLKAPCETILGKIRIQMPELAMWVIWTTGFAYSSKKLFKKWKDKLDPELVQSIKIGFNYSTENIKSAEFHRELIYNNICKHFKEYDILITPTLACPAFRLGISDAEEINGKKVGPGAWMLYTFPFNMSGHPVASIPCGWSSDGLPIGMQIIGNRFDELTVLQVSKAFEELQPWQDKKPQFN